jgi:quercetin dioxygenase-like cupin family protein
METSQATHVRWDDVPRERVGPLIERRYVSGVNMTLGQFFLSQGCLVPTHEHESEQFVNVVAGKLRLRLGADGAEVADVAAGEVLMIPPHRPHSAEALEDTIVFDSFAPTRKDWLEKRDDYFRR